jgi:hypothetical protein
VHEKRFFAGSELSECEEVRYCATTRTLHTFHRATHLESYFFDEARGSSRSNARAAYTLDRCTRAVPFE